MYGDKSIDKPDWLPDDPTSDEASQMVLNQSETLEQAQITGYMSGYFDGEGCVRANVSVDDDLKLNYHFNATLKVETSQVAGLFDAEGSISLSPMNRGHYRLNHRLKPQIRVSQVQDKTMLEDIFDSYNDYIDFDYGLSKRNNENDPHRQPTVEVNICTKNSIRNFLAPLLPMLKEKQEQAIIMLREIIPRLERGVHLNKEGFIELMKWKELLDREKPMGNEDRKYTVEYFQDLWADDLDDDAQSDLTHFQSAHGD
ncbi:hypothetical protein 7778G3H09_2 [Haloquadratum phage sp.]|nr:hypothetical protein 7778G3H09_2 [Haloquadratum phage sp.]